MGCDSIGNRIVLMGINWWFGITGEGGPLPRPMRDIKGGVGRSNKLRGKAEGLAVSRNGVAFGRRRTRGRKGRQATTIECGLARQKGDLASWNRLSPEEGDELGLKWTASEVAPKISRVGFIM